MIRSRAARKFIFSTIVASCLGAAASAVAAPAFTLESGDRVSDATPESITGDYATSLRLYFIREFSVRSATGTDGLAWTEEAGIRVSSETPGAVLLSSVTSASVLPITGGFRMMLTVSTGTNYQIVSASSTNGLDWGLEGVKITHPAGTFAGSIRLLEQSDGSWLSFFVRASQTGFSSSTFRVYMATSADDGVTWGPAVQVFGQEAHGVAPSLRTDGRLRIYYTAPLANGTTATQVLSALSTSAGGVLVLNQEAGVRLSTAGDAGTLASPLALRDAETFRWRLYFSYLSTATLASPNAVSAITRSPDPQSLSPGSVARTVSGTSFAVSGEIFESTVTVKLTRAGEADIPGTSVVVTNDQTISAVFDTLNAALGQWDLVVTNNDGQSGTLANALTVDFEEGRVALLDNVFRPLRGQNVRIDVTVFNDGRLTMKLFTLEGRYIRTLLDADVATGTTTVTWDGRTDDGNLVASGVYLVTMEGPRLDLRRKVVVIK